MALLDSPDEITALLPTLKTIAVLGIKMEPAAPGYYVPAFAKMVGIRVIPVPVYYPDATEILGERVFRRLADIPEPVDAVVVFRRPQDIPAHVDDILAAKPRVVWMQLGIRHDEVAQRLSDAGIAVVQDKCLLVELRQRGVSQAKRP
ncbi:MAG TPA: CoA-binding protein [Gemmatimonadaceae bacterium]|nr:CoA-binding protein [Gemmatimonadaceae bacterium]